jgi:FdhD protein
MKERPGSSTRTRVRVVEDGKDVIRRDSLATEEPLEVRLVAGAQRRILAVTMRTPGHDFELVSGFLHGEGVISSRDEIVQISYCTDQDIDLEQRYNIVNVRLDSGTLPELPGLERHFATSSACGVCGKASLDALKLRGCTGCRMSCAARKGYSNRPVDCMPQRCSRRPGSCWCRGRTSADTTRSTR